jgi:arylsulfatase A-like enzyme
MGKMRKCFNKTIAFPFLAAATLLFAPACSDRPEELVVENEMNVLLITIDTLRADRLGCYGYDKPVSRMIDAVAARGVQFNDCVTQSSVTPISHASILTGQNPYRHGVRTLKGGKPYKLGRDHSTLATLLKAAGYDTAAFISAMPLIAQHFGLDNGFDIYEQSFYEDVEFVQEFHYVDSRRRENPTQRRADLTNELAIDWLQKRESGPFFLWVHYFDVHETYLVPPVIPGVFTYEIEKPLTDIHPQMYDVELRFVDMMISNLVDELYRLGVGHDTLIVITSDHGQGLSDHDYPYHTMKLYQEQIRVPLIFAGGALPPGVKPKGLVRSIDIAPTILDITGYPPESIPADIEGVSLRPMWEDRALEGGAAMRAYSETSYPKEIFGESPVFSVIEGGMKFISYPESRGENELFDLSSDPMELNNIISERPERAKELEKTIARLQDGTVFDVERASAGDNKKTQSLLKSLGYLNK